MDENQSNQNNSFNNFESTSQNNNTSSSFRNVKPNEATYKSFQSSKNAPKSGAGFGKTVVLPFFCGILGTAIVICACITVPPIKSFLVKQLVTVNNSSASNSSASNSSNNGSSYTPINTQLVSLSGYSDTAVGVANKVQPSIVAISVEYSVNSIFNRTSSTATARGSGIIISEDGYILTNNHVVNSTSSSSNSFYTIGEASKVTVKLYNDNTEYEGEIIGTDSQTDLAVIKIKKDNLTAAELGDSDSVQVGEFAMAIR